MSHSNQRQPVLARNYQRYLDDQDAAALIDAVAQIYTVGTLQRLAENGNTIHRRAAILSLGMVGDFSCNATLGRALHDKDRCVRLLADDGIRRIWQRVGSAQERTLLRSTTRLNDCGEHGLALEETNDLLAAAPHIAEAWNQRAIAHYRLNRFEEAAFDAFQALELNPYHFLAASCLGHCHLKMKNPSAALESFKRALDLNPQLEDIRVHVARLRRSLS